LASNPDLPKRASRSSKAGSENLRVIGEARQRIDVRGKVTGQTVYADDISLPRMAYCKILRSPHPHARIRNWTATTTMQASIQERVRYAMMLLTMTAMDK